VRALALLLHSAMTEPALSWWTILNRPFDYAFENVALSRHERRMFDASHDTAISESMRGFLGA
jgi:hypothetical protein